MSNINCTEFGNLIEQAVESRTAVDSAVLRAHAADCAGCRAAWLDAMLLDGAVAEWRKTGKKILPSVDLADIVLARRASGLEPVVSADMTPFAAESGTLHPAETIDRVVEVRSAVADDAKPTRRSTRRRVAGSAIALALMACVAFFWSRAGRDNEVLLIQKATPIAPVPTVAHNNSQRTVPSPNNAVKLAVASRDSTVKTPAPTPTKAGVQPPAEPPVEAMVQGAQTAYLDLANQAAKAVAEATALVPRPSLASVMSQSPDDSDRWVDDVGHQFEPVGKNLSQAFQFIFEAVPADKAPAT
jgi:hypothetical protein